MRLCLVSVAVRACVCVFVFDCFYDVSDYAADLFGLDSFVSCLCGMTCYGGVPRWFSAFVLWVIWWFGVVTVLL